MDVVHVLFPIVARTRTDPKPRRSPPARSRISSDSLAGRLTKVQVSVRRASHSHSSALKTTFTDLACHASLAPQVALCSGQDPASLATARMDGTPISFSVHPIMWMFIAILATFLITRTVTRLIRSGSGAGAGLGNVRLAGVHVHHQVFGILIIIGTGIVLVSATPHGAALDVAAAVFGAGVGLTVYECALWLHLEDVYWADQGRKSVDAIFCVLVITGVLIGGANFATGHVGTAAWWSSVAVIAVNLLLCVICLLKGKVVTGVVGVFVSVVALVGAIRLAKPGSWWAAHRYAGRPRLAARAARRFDERHHDRWNWVRDLVAGAPSQERSGG